MSEIYARFRGVVAAFPTKVAIHDGIREVKYSELLEVVDSLASQFEGAGRVVVDADSGADAYAVLLACLKIGAAYIPVRPSELEKMDAAFPSIFRGALWWSRQGLSRTEGGPTDLPRYAYILFTSGTSGCAKAVGIYPEQLSTYLENVLRVDPYGPEARAIQLFDLTFDLSLHVVLTALTTGATLFPLPRELFRVAGRLVEERRITHWFSVPYVAEEILRRPEGNFRSLRTSMFCGEPLKTDVALAWKAIAPESSIWNLYGPTEATIAISAHRFSGNDNLRATVPIGMPFPGHDFRIEDDGELALRGPQVAESYLFDQQASETKFLKDGWYLSGDLVESVSDGGLYFRGRKERVAKFKGRWVSLDDLQVSLGGEFGEVALVCEASGILSVRTLADDREIEGTRSVFVERLARNASGKLDYREILSEAKLRVRIEDGAAKLLVSADPDYFEAISGDPREKQAAALRIYVESKGTGIALRESGGEAIGLCACYSLEEYARVRTRWLSSVLRGFDAEGGARVGERLRALSKSLPALPDRGFFIPFLAVHPDFRGRGIGLELLNAAVAQVSSEVNSFIRRDNAFSLALFRKLGFEAENGADGPYVRMRLRVKS